MFRQLICPVVAVIIALVGIGGFLVNSEKSNRAVTEKEVTDQGDAQESVRSGLNQQEQRLDDINLLLASRISKRSPPALNQSQIEQAPWLDPSLDSIYQQIRNQKLSIRFPTGQESFVIWVGNPRKTVNGKKVYQHAEVLKKTIPLINQLPFPVRIWFYGTRDQSNPELDECIESLAGVSNLAGIKFSYCHINERGYTALQNLANLTNLEVLYSNLSNAGLEKIVQNKNLRRLHLNLGRTKLSSPVLEKLTELPALEDLKVIGLLEPEKVASFWEKLTACQTLVCVEVDFGSVTQKMMIDFLKGPHREKLKKLKIYEIFPQQKLANALICAPNLEVLKMPSGKPAAMIYLLEQLSKHHSHIKSLAIGWDAGDHLQGDQARIALGLLACFPDLKEFHVPVSLPEPSALQPLTRLEHLEYFYCQNLNLDQETLLLLAQMPILKKLTVDSLEFDQGSAHVLPWLSNMQHLEIRDPMTLTDERLSLLATIPHLSKLKWCDIALKEPIPLTEEARARYQYIEFDVCRK